MTLGSSISAGIFIGIVVGFVVGLLIALYKSRSKSKKAIEEIRGQKIKHRIDGNPYDFVGGIDKQLKKGKDVKEDEEKETIKDKPKSILQKSKKEIKKPKSKKKSSKKKIQKKR